MSEAIETTRHWLEKIVIGLNLCPFAERPYLDQRVGYVDCNGNSVDDVYREFIALMERLLLPPQLVDTALLIVTKGLEDFGGYLDTLALLEDSIDKAGLADLIQVASFHPDYCFDGVAPDDPANFSNRSPYPMFHLIRQDLLEEVLSRYLDPEQIPERNVARLRELGNARIRALLED